MIVSAKSWESVARREDDEEVLPSLGSTSITKMEC